MTDVDERVTLVEGDVSFLFDEQVIQDERLLSLEQENDVIDDELESEFLCCEDARGFLDLILL